MLRTLTAVAICGGLLFAGACGGEEPEIRTKQTRSERKATPRPKSTSAVKAKITPAPRKAQAVTPAPVVEGSKPAQTKQPAAATAKPKPKPADDPYSSPPPTSGPADPDVPDPPGGPGY